MSNQTNLNFLYDNFIIWPHCITLLAKKEKKKEKKKMHFTPPLVQPQSFANEIKCTLCRKRKFALFKNDFPPPSSLTAI